VSIEEIKKMSGTAISAVVPMYRGEQTIVAALRSVLDQAVDKLEVLVFDDGSPDRCAATVQQLREDSDDARIVLHRHDNRGLAGTLNRGIDLASGVYIARQDQDDIVLPGRLQKQFDFLESHRDVALVGTWAQIYVGDEPSQRYHRHPAAHDALRLELLFDNPFVHSSVMMRTDIVRGLGGYCEDRSRQPPEDYELWSRIARHHKVANIPEVLTIYREIPGSMSRVGDNPFLKNVIKISSENLSHALGANYSLADCMGLARLYHGEPVERALSKRRVRQMINAAAMVIGGDPADWSDDFRVSLARMRRHLDSRFLRRRLPAPLLSLARRVKRKFLEKRG
jgi:glycosyltransferase involved in cell wall biosynthesis